MKILVLFACVLAVTIWGATCLGHFCDRKAEMRKQKVENLIEEMGR